MSNRALQIDYVAWLVATVLLACPLASAEGALPVADIEPSVVRVVTKTSVDVGIGQIVDQLDQLGLSENTAIVFTSDNGGYGPATSMSPLKGYKGTYYEGGIREPFFVTWPGVVDPGTTCDEPIINVDLYPTFCQMAGAALPSGQPLDGQNLKLFA